MAVEVDVDIEAVEIIDADVVVAADAIVKADVVVEVSEVDADHVKQSKVLKRQKSMAKIA